MTTEHATLAALREALPEREFRAVRLWLEMLYPFQREWVLCWDRFAICNKGRQMGMTHSTAAAAVLWAMLAEQTSIISIGQFESDEVLLKAKLHAEALCELGSTWAAPTATASDISFRNSGGRILARPASSAGRSLSGNVILDEFGYHGAAHDHRVWDGAAAVTLHGGKLRVISTPNGVGNLFYEIWSNETASAGFTKFEFPIARAIDDGMKLKMDKLWTIARGDPRVFGQIFECQFLDGAEQYIPTKLIQQAVLETTAIEDGFAYGGLDVGGGHDLTAIEIIRQSSDNRVWRQEGKTCKRSEWDEQLLLVDEAFERWDLRRLCIDATGMGHGLTQALIKRYGRSRIEAVVFTQQSKEVLVTDLYQAFADRMLYIQDDKALAKDLTSLRRIVTTAGNIRYDAPRTTAGHGDRAWALALAIHACTDKPARPKSSGEGDYENA